MPNRLAMLFCIVLLLACIHLAHADPTQVQINIKVGCTDPTLSPVALIPGNTTDPNIPIFTQVIADPSAIFISLHFTYFNLPTTDYVIVRPTDPGDTTTPRIPYRYGSFVAPYFTDQLTTTSITIELYSATGLNDPNQCYGFAIDSYRNKAISPDAEKEDVCGPVDDSEDAACCGAYAGMLQQAAAVTRLVINKPTGSIFCTGWLVGCEGHVLTNNHCIESQDSASNTKFEFLAFGNSCSDDCAKPYGCPGKIRASSAKLIVTNATLDYTLVQLDASLSNDYGYLRMRESGAVLNERIYIPQYPAGWGMRIAMKAKNTWGTVENTALSSVLNNVPFFNQVGYSLDTRGGSSGSPVIASIDNAVVALHHSGGCPNAAINTRDIIADLRANGFLPKCAVV